MKLPLLILAALMLGAGPCELCRPAEAHAAVAGYRAPAAAPSSAALDTAVLNIEGMDCGGCTIATRKVLERLDGVMKADVSYEEKRAVVTFDPQKVTTQQMIAAVATLKYTATVVPPSGRPVAKPWGRRDPDSGT